MGQVFRITGLFLVLLFVSPSWAARLKGKSLDRSVFKAELDLDGGSPVQGRVRFLRDKRAEFIAHNGVHKNLRIRAICAVGLNDVVDSCWPDLAVEMNDTNSTRNADLKILGPSH